MANINLDFEELGRNIESIVDRAVNSHDYQKLDQTIRQMVDKAVNVSTTTARKVADAAGSSGKAKTHAAEPLPPKKTDLSVLYSRTNGKTAGGILKIVGGGLLLSNR